MEIGQNSTATWVKHTKHRYGNPWKSPPCPEKEKNVLSCLFIKKRQIHRYRYCQITEGWLSKLCFGGLLRTSFSYFECLKSQRCMLQPLWASSSHIPSWGVGSPNMSRRATTHMDRGTKNDLVVSKSKSRWEKAQNMVLYIPGTQKTPVLIGTGLVLEGSTPKTKDKWVPGIDEPVS